MERVVPWSVLVEIVAPHYPKAKTGRPPFGIETMVAIPSLSASAPAGIASAAAVRQGRGMPEFLPASGALTCRPS
jgi:hypothetical protein